MPKLLEKYRNKPDPSCNYYCVDCAEKIRGGFVFYRDPAHYMNWNFEFKCSTCGKELDTAKDAYALTFKKRG